jgi:uncharacterized membrane protein YedE/YeeE
MEKQNRIKYLNPYFAGFLLGFLLLLTFYITGRGLGATGAVKNVVVGTVHEVAPEHTQELTYYSMFIGDNKNPFKNWMVFEVIGVFMGALISGAVWGRLKRKNEHGPRITGKKRLIYAFIGGLLFAIGAQFARGCTSGAALSGSVSMSLAGFLIMLLIFGTGFAFAILFRKLWV